MTTAILPTVLITGGLGFIGTKIIDRIKHTHRILVVDNLHSQVHQDRRRVDELPRSVTLIEGDVTNVSVLTEAAEFAPEVVIHLAAETGTGQSLRESRRHAEVNVTGTATLLDALSAREYFPRRVIVPSSRAVYGEGMWTDAATGEAVYASARKAPQLAAGDWTPLGRKGERLATPVAHNAASVEPRPANVYAATKLAQEHIAQAWCTAFEVPLTILRLQNVYGDGQSVANPYTGVLTFMARQALSCQPISVFEGGGIVRDFVDVEDVADAIVASMHYPNNNLRADIGSGRPTTLLAVAELLSELAGSAQPVTSAEFRLGDVRAASANIAVAQRELGFEPSQTLAAGLESLLAWVDREQN